MKFRQINRMYKIIIEPAHDKTNKVVCAPSEASDQPGHPHEETFGPLLPK